ncbi:hypothetical protein B0H11DRAFT_2211813 [Mycena galericulata]|nr:hypothetical protein B0H11DRAFT_2211813 [Mycena galericulata]
MPPTPMTHLPEEAHLRSLVAKVFDQPIMLGARQKKNTAAETRSAPHSSEPRAMTTTSWTESAAGNTTHAWLAKSLHNFLFALVYGPIGYAAAGKVLLIVDPKFANLHQNEPVASRIFENQDIAFTKTHSTPFGPEQGYLKHLPESIHQAPRLRACRDAIVLRSQSELHVHFACHASQDLGDVASVVAATLPPCELLTLNPLRQAAVGWIP